MSPRERSGWERRSAELWPEIDLSPESRLILLPSGPGDEFFPQLPPGTEMDDECAMALRGFRRLLATRNPHYVSPGDTHGEIDDYYEMLLTIRHAGDPTKEIWLDLGDGLSLMGWPQGKLTGVHEARRFLLTVTAILESLLTGSNTQTLDLRLRRLVRSTLQVHDEAGSTTFETDYRPWRTRPLRLIPAWRARRVQRRINFDLDPPISVI